MGAPPSMNAFYEKFSTLWPEADGRPSLNPIRVIRVYFWVFTKATFGFYCSAYDMKILGVFYAKKPPKKPI